jgi:Uma2 family endonuclease
MIAQPIELENKVGMTTRRFTVDEYLRMAELGFFAESDRLELIRGEIIEMSPINVAHVNCVNRLNAILSRIMAGRAIVSIQNPIILDEFSAPQPDVALWKLVPDQYEERLAGPEEILLVIEVADTSIDHDRKVKTLVYATAGISDYYIVNLPERQIEVYREPRSTGYRTTTRYMPGDTLPLLAFPESIMSVDEILGITS